MVAVIAPLLRLSEADHVVDDGFAIGLGMGLVAAGHLLLAFPMATPPAGLMQVVVAVLVSTHVAATALVLRQRALARPIAWLLVATVPAIGLEIYIHSRRAFGATDWVVAGSVGRAAVGAGLDQRRLGRHPSSTRRRAPAHQQLPPAAGHVHPRPP